MLSAEISARRKNGHTLAAAKLIKADDGLQVGVSNENRKMFLPNWNMESLEFP